MSRRVASRRGNLHPSPRSLGERPKFSDEDGGSELDEREREREGTK